MGPIFPNPEFFLHINMDKVLLWTVHSSRNDRCQIKVQNSPTLHSLHSPPINKRILVLLSRKTLLIIALLCNARELSSQPFRAYTILHIHFSPLMWGSIVSSNVIIWILAETFEVHLGGPLSWTEPCRATEMVHYGYLRRAMAFLLAGINYSVTCPWYPACWEPFAFRQNGAKITNICLTEIPEGCSSLSSPT